MNKILFILLICLTGCRTSTAPDLLTIRIDPGKFIALNLDTILKYSTITPLEYSPEALLAEGGRVAYIPEGFFISNYRAQLFHFDTAGNFVKRIGAVGEGPGEYISSREKIIYPTHLTRLSDGGIEMDPASKRKGNRIQS